MVKESAEDSIIIKQKWRVFLWRAFDEKQWLKREKTVLCMVYHYNNDVSILEHCHLYNYRNKIRSTVVESNSNKHYQAL